MDYSKLSKTYTPEVGIAMTNQRTHEMKTFKKDEIQLQIEGENGEYVSVRGKYPNDAWFATCYFVMLTEVEKPTQTEKAFHSKKVRNQYRKVREGKYERVD